MTSNLPPADRAITDAIEAHRSLGISPEETALRLLSFALALLTKKAGVSAARRWLERKLLDLAAEHMRARAGRPAVVPDPAPLFVQPAPKDPQ